MSYYENEPRLTRALNPAPAEKQMQVEALQQRATLAKTRAMTVAGLCVACDGLLMGGWLFSIRHIKPWNIMLALGLFLVVATFIVSIIYTFMDDLEAKVRKGSL